MMLVERFWTVVSCLLNILTFSPFSQQPGDGAQQLPLLNHDVDLAAEPGPIFPPPGRLRRGFNDNFTCDYRSMLGWVDCSTPDDRGCWLKNRLTGRKLDIYSDYELKKFTPRGIVRHYNLTVAKSPLPINVDGMDFVGGFMFNEHYPGPWIQACWGDTLSITVNVDPKFEMGTSIHWHGIRQWLSMQMDGVPGITQCPIAPGSSFTYTFKAMQYGSSWYHSHYSLQYADGLLGPMTIHGPSSDEWDLAPAKPLFISDWNHNVVTQTNNAQSYRTVLLGGIGNMTRCYPDDPAAPITKYQDVFNVTFERGKKHLLRVINVAYDSTFLFSIDNHNFTVISTDFVHIEKYPANSIAVGIGQRYNIVVDANPIDSDASDFWIRTHVIKGDNCHTGDPPPGPDYMNTGIIRYNETSRADPTTSPWKDLNTTYCRDEPASTPKVTWDPQKPANEAEPIREIQFGDSTPVNPGTIAFQNASENPPVFMPLRIDWQNITFLNLDNRDGWNDSFVVLPEQYKETQWIYLVMTNPGDDKGHPIHLHGHDFGIMEVAANKTFDPKAPLPIKFNPPRRDVVYLPEFGYVIIAFKADNPGGWLIHCHIARHASNGLAMQVLEDRVAADARWPPHSPAWKAADDVCTAWKDWCSKLPGKGCNNLFFQTDSGI